MKKFVGVVLTILLGLAVASGQERTPKSDATEKVLLDNERALYEAVAKRDKAAFQALVLPEGTWASPTGFVPVRLLVDSLDVFQLPAFGGQSLHVVWTDRNKDSALVLYPRTGGGTFANQPGFNRMDEAQRKVGCGSSPRERCSEAVISEKDKRPRRTR